MRIRVKLHGLLTAGMGDPGGLHKLDVAEGADVATVIEAFQERSALFDPRSILAVIENRKVPLSHVLLDGDELHLYHLFSGG
jgi:hypothetical protein